MKDPLRRDPDKPVDRSRTIPLTGYFDEISGRAGDRLGLKVSAARPGPCTARMVRVVSGDPNPAGPGLQLVPVADWPERTFDARHQEIDIGSYAIVPDFVPPDASPLLFSIRIQPWLLRDVPSVIAAAGEAWRLDVSKAGLRLRLGAHGPQLDAAAALKRKHWYQIWAGWDAARGEMVLGCRGIEGPERPADVAVDICQMGALAGARPTWTEPLSFAAVVENGLSRDHFNGRLEDPMMHRGWRPQGPPDDPTEDGEIELLAWWDFSQDIDSQRIVDRGPRGTTGRLVNVPTRAVRGSRWRGRAMKWTEAPPDYAAIHFHEDDLYDCGWDTDLEVDIPGSLASGVYAMQLEKDGHTDTVPFYVLPPRGLRRNAICFLAPTFTYQAYANMARGNCDDAMRARMKAWGAAEWNPDDFDIYGFSTYNFHPDGSGHCFSSRRRPIMTWRPGFLTFVDPAGSGLRHFPADTHLLSWLERKGFGFDVVTDEDLDVEGADLLAGYAVVLTGSHPEYHTAATLDAIRAYQESGGNFCYLGGNGFYWRVERSDALPGMIELRRAETGVRAWATEPGENYHQLRPTHGGLWRRSGRAPQQLVGVGFTSQGPFEGSFYHVEPGARESTAGWILAGVDEEPLGGYGLNGGGAAGFELDRADVELGAPEETIVVARSSGHGDSFTPVPEDILSAGRTETGTDPDSIVRADMVYFRRPSGCQVFAVGSILFCGSLLYNDADNGISRILSNVLRRFAGAQGTDPT